MNIDHLTKTPLLTRAEEYELTERYRRGDLSAKHRMIEANMRLVVNIARMYLGHGIDLEDLVQDGSIGLMRAVEKFQPERGFGFSTYASFWITNAVQRSVLRLEHEIYVPADVAARRRQIETARGEKPEATDAELASAIGCTPQQFLAATTSARVVTSLDRDRLDEGHGTLGDIIPDERADAEEELRVSERLRDLERRPLDEPFALMFGDPTIQAALSALPAIQRRVLELRFGFDGEPRTQEHVAQVLGNCSAQWIGELEWKAIESLREVLGVDGS